ncbi:diadenosine tetraphosphate (Ap4A) HIT family hydrolase [Nonomuraea polychroma]|uniref:Diadenosine tetraphosphate (Ap4A) HIT family hydrolase n=1 Tax=Nonomuraea polychroma TaxID=46176 RepID=A0A438M5R8_9ACTN|nr:HIT domain-containing protein [Nonomuraea polychroma]RVX40927.1 diadenosine tetraphosphate (Ap4A) HIT family hydrolase [Nonomuraea polychroma]
MPDCPFCLPKIEPEIVVANDHCYAIYTQGATPEGSAMIIPLAHRPTVFDLTRKEWAATQQLLHEMKKRLTTSHAPDGWNVGWNVGSVGGQSVDHAHCHLVPRYEGEPLAGRGLRFWIKDPSNRPPHHLPAPQTRPA